MIVSTRTLIQQRLMKRRRNLVYRTNYCSSENSLRIPVNWRTKIWEAENPTAAGGGASPIIMSYHGRKELSPNNQYWD